MRTWILGCLCIFSLLYLGAACPFSQSGYYQITDSKATPARYIKVNLESIDLIGPDYKIIKSIVISGKKGNHWVGSEDSFSSGLHVYSFSFEPSSIRWYPYGVYFKVINPLKLAGLMTKK